eukprot:TRINITY_DN7950_c1_g2_i1.p1 TRINITY_DN7950_c1_g2~~TRINITY_DN7950_c1_g2_i1.p1  ORF type:complete len:347 (+),score=100.46 TRINITY_DN7950_c1_g2_i1:51-1091(+)
MNTKLIAYLLTFTGLGIYAGMNYSQNTKLGVIREVVYVPVPVNNTVPSIPSIPSPAPTAATTEINMTSCPGTDPKVYTARTPEPFYLCTHGNSDMVSGSFIRIGYWYDCPSLRDVLGALKRVLNISGLVEVVEVGGNIGTCAWVMAAYGAQVTSYEPVPKNFALLKRSTEINKLKYGDRVVPHNKGCGSTEGSLTIKSERGNMGNSVMVRHQTEERMTALLEGRKTVWDEERITITTLDSEIRRHVHFLKIDCQGHEIEVLLGAKQLLTAYGVDAIKAEFFTDFLTSSGHAARELLDILNGHGYEVLHDGRVVPPSTFETFQMNKKTDIFAVKKGVIPPHEYFHFR